MFPTANITIYFPRKQCWDRTKAPCAKRLLVNYKNDLADTKRLHERNKNTTNSLHWNSMMQSQVTTPAPFPFFPYTSTNRSVQIPSRNVDGHAAVPQRAPPSSEPLQLGRPTCGCRGCGIRYRCLCTLEPPQWTRRLQPLEALSVPWLRWGRAASLESGWDVGSRKFEARNTWAIS